MKVCVNDEVCSTCPWREGNGHQLQINVIRQMMVNGTISPCHQELAKVTGTPYEGVEIYAAKVKRFKVCRGLVAAKQVFFPFGVDPVWEKLYIEYEKTYSMDEPDIVSMSEVISGNIGH